MGGPGRGAGHGLGRRAGGGVNVDVTSGTNVAVDSRNGVAVGAGVTVAVAVGGSGWHWPRPGSKNWPAGQMTAEAVKVGVGVTVAVGRPGKSDWNCGPQTGPALIGVQGAAGQPAGVHVGRDERKAGHRQTALAGEAVRAIADEEVVRATVHHAAGQRDRVLHTVHRGHCPEAQRLAVHKDRVEFDFAVPVQVAAVAGVEQRIVLEEANGSLDGVEGGAAAQQDVPAGVGRRPGSGALGRHVGRRVEAGAAVDEDGGHHDGACLRRAYGQLAPIALTTPKTSYRSIMPFGTTS